jgi:hypothetical protein
MAFPLRVSVSPEHLETDPGDAPTVEVTVRNTSDIVEHYVIDLLGLPAGSGAHAEPEVTKLRPGETGTAAVRIAVPSEPPAPAGLYTLGVLVRSRYRDDVSRCEELPLTVAQVEAVSVRVEPEVATGGRSARYVVDVVNGGNIPLRLQLTAADPERKVVWSFQPSMVDLPPGTVARTMLAVRAPVPWSRETRRALTVAASGPDAQGKTVATFVQRPRFASKLTRVAGVLGAVLVLAGAIVAAALIAGRDDPAPGDSPSKAASGGPVTTAAPKTPQAASTPPTQGTTPTAPVTTGPASSPPATQPPPPPPVAPPQEVDLARAAAGTVLASDTFRQQGILLSGLPNRDTPLGCMDATGVAVQGGDAGGRFITASRPDDAAACNEVPVQIRFVEAAGSVQVVLGGQGTRRMEVVYRDLSRTVETDLLATDDGRRGGIDFVVIRGLPAGPGNAAPPAAVRSVTFTLAPPA